MSAKQYWEGRLSAQFSLGGVGDQRLGIAYNHWLYRARRRALDRSLKTLSIDARGKRVLDIGSGTGFYVDYWLEKGAAAVSGVDITEVSVRNLARRYPGGQFVCADIASDDLSRLGTFDIISAFDVLFHIVDDEGFKTAFSNIRRCSHDGAYVLVSDHFPPQDTPLGPQESHRSDSHYRAVSEAAGLQVVQVSPVFYAMAAPLDASEISPLARWLWPLTCATLKVSRPLRLNALFGHALGLPLYLLDGLLLRLVGSGPTLKLMVLRPANV